MKTLFIFILAACIQACSGNVSEKIVVNKTDGKVIAVTDGDTFSLLTESREKIRVRLHGIDCPEKKQDFGMVAKQKLSDLVFGKEVRILKKDIDRYGRTVAIVYDDKDNCINEEMLKSGLAWHYTKYDQDPQWQQMENSARENRLGLWSQPDPTPPWEWRSKKVKKNTQPELD